MSENKSISIISHSLPCGEEANQIITWSNTLVKSSHYANMGSAGITAILLTARELGLPPMACLNGGLYQIKGKVTLSAQMMNTLVLKAGHFVDIIESNDRICVLRFKRKDRDNHTDYSYSIEEAKKSGYLTKENWRLFTKDMLYCRCLSGGARKICPDAIGNCYMHGEFLEDIQSPIVHENQEVIQVEGLEEVKVQDTIIENEVLPDDLNKFLEENDLLPDSKSEKRKLLNEMIESTTRTELEVIENIYNNFDKFLALFEKRKKTESLKSNSSY